MRIPTLPTNISPLGIPADEFKLYIGKPLLDPREIANQVDVFDADNNNVQTSNPLYVGPDGFYRTQSFTGVRVNPTVTETAVSLMWVDPVGTPVRHIKNYILDTSGGDAGGGQLVDNTLNNFGAALQADLTADSFIYIQSYAVNWEGTAAGPVGGFYAYRTGSSGTPSSGNPGKFYDSAGNEWKPAQFQRLYLEMFGGKSGIGNDNLTPLNDMADAMRDLVRPGYLGDSDYYVGTSTTTAPNYSLVAFYAVNGADCHFIGTGNTRLVNTNANNAQYMIFAEDADSFIMEGIKIDMQSNNTTTGALYMAGVLDVELSGFAALNGYGCNFASSTTRQTGSVKINGAPTFSGMSGAAITGNGGGFKSLYVESIITDGSIDINYDDPDAHGVAKVSPDVNIGPIVGGTMTGKNIINAKVGTISHGPISYKTCADIHNISYVAGEPLPNLTAGFVTGGNITGTGLAIDVSDTAGGFITSEGYSIGNCAQPMSVTRTVAIAQPLTGIEIEKFNFGNATDGFECDNDDAGVICGAIKLANVNGGAITNTQLFVKDCTNFVLQNFSFQSGTNFLINEDSSRTKVIQIQNGTMGTVTNGINTTTAGQNIDIKGVDFSGATTNVVDLTLNNYRASDCQGFTDIDFSLASIDWGDSSGVSLYSYEINAAQTATFTDAREGDYCIAIWSDYQTSLDMTSIATIDPIPRDGFAVIAVKIARITGSGQSGNRITPAATVPLKLIKKQW